MSVTVTPASPQLWNDVVRVFGSWGSNPDACWCQRFRQHDEPDEETGRTYASRPVMRRRL